MFLLFSPIHKKSLEKAPGALVLPFSALTLDVSHPQRVSFIAIGSV